MRNRVLIVEDNLEEYKAALTRVQRTQVPRTQPVQWQVDYAHNVARAEALLQQHFADYALLILDNDLNGVFAIEKLVLPLLGNPQRPPIIIWSGEGHYTADQRAFAEQMGSKFGNVFFCKKGLSDWRLERMIQDVLDFEWRRGRLTEEICVQNKLKLCEQLVLPYGHSAVEQIWIQLERLRAVFTPVYISGAAGTRTDVVAEQLHWLYVGGERFADRPDIRPVRIDGAALAAEHAGDHSAERSLAMLDAAFESAKESKTTLILNHAGALAGSAQQRLRRYATAYPRPHIILLDVLKQSDLTADNPLGDLLEKIKVETLHLTTFRERIALWPDAMRTLFECLEDFGMEEGEEMLFLRPDEEALRMLLAAQWPLNALEFRALCSNIYHSESAQTAIRRMRGGGEGDNPEFVVTASLVKAALCEVAEQGILTAEGPATLPVLNYKIRQQEFNQSYWDELSARCGGDRVRMSRMSGLNRLELERLERKLRGIASSKNDSGEIDE